MATRATVPPLGVVLAATIALLTVPAMGSLGSLADPVHEHVHADDDRIAPTKLLEMVNGGQKSGPSDAVPQVADGFFLQPLAPAGFPTTIAFGPGDDGPDLYVATLPSEGTAGVDTRDGVGTSDVFQDPNAFAGQVLRVHLDWTPAGPITEEIEQVATGFNRPNGLTFDDDGNLYVTDRTPNAVRDREDGRITKLDLSDSHQSDGTVILDGLPNDRHSTNHIRFASDGETLLIPNGNPNDFGCPRDENGDRDCGGDALDAFPISGAVLAVNATNVSQDPVEIEWADANGDPIDPYQLWDHPVNADARENITVVASGFRNIYDITEAPAALPYNGTLYTAMNGADDPSSQDALFKLPNLTSPEIGKNYTYPFCYNVGPPGGVGDDVATEANPRFSDHPAAAGCANAPEGEALLGWHTCTTGLDFPHDADASGEVPDAAFPQTFRSSVFVSECFHIFATDWANQTRQDPANATHSTSHKVTRVILDDDGNATGVRDFVTGLAAPTDVQFGPDGAMYIADTSGIHRVAPTEDATVDVQTAGVQFVPQVVVVPEGTTVAWHGNAFGHTVTTSDSQCVNSLVTPSACTSNAGSGPDTFHEGLDPGETVTHTWSTSGLHEYFCRPHRSLSMVGAVLVTPGLS